MDPTLKNILTGAAVQLGAKSASALGFYLNGSKTVPGWYDSVPGVGAIAPSIDDWVLDLGLPAGLFLGGKLMARRNPKTAVKLKEMAIGAGLTGIATFMHDLLNRVGHTLTPMSYSPRSYSIPTSQLSTPTRYSIAPAQKGMYK